MGCLNRFFGLMKVGIQNHRCVATLFVLQCKGRPSVALLVLCYTVYKPGKAL